MSIMLQGNIANEAVFEAVENKKNLVFRGNAVCYDDLHEFSNITKSNGLDKNHVIILRMHNDVDLEIYIRQYLKSTELIDQDAEYLIISNLKLPPQKGVYSVYVKTPDYKEEEPLFLIRNGDNLFLDIDAGVLYLYVADVELIYRKYELKIIQ